MLDNVERAACVQLLLLAMEQSKCWASRHCSYQRWHARTNYIDPSVLIDESMSCWEYQSPAVYALQLFEVDVQSP